MTPLYEARMISSTYFDNKNFDCYKDSQEGLLPRKKLRIRNYPNTDVIKFNEEIKTSSIEGRFKISNALTPKATSSLMRFGIKDKIYGVCYPVLLVSYMRTYYTYDKVRITFDTDITYVNHSNKFLLKDPETVIEIKAEDIYTKQYLEDLISIPRRRFSKYSRGVEKVIMRI